MNPYKLSLLLFAMLISFSTVAQEANMEAINKSLKPKPKDNLSYEMMIPDFRWGFNIQGFIAEMSNEKNLTMGTYFKYKPFYRFDIDAGFKYYLSSLDSDDLNFMKNEVSYEYAGFSGTQIYLAINSSLALNKLNSHTALFTSIEAGYANSKSDLTQYNKANEPIAMQALRDGKMYVEWKLGLNFYGDFFGANTGAKLFVGLNTVPYFLSGHTHRHQNEIGYDNDNSGMLLLGLAFEFGIKKTPGQKADKKRNMENQSIIEKYRGKPDKLF